DLDAYRMALNEGQGVTDMRRETDAVREIVEVTEYLTHSSPKERSRPVGPLCERGHCDCRVGFWGAPCEGFGMRFAIPCILLAACSSSTSRVSDGGSPGDDGSSPGDDAGSALSCGITLAAYCTSNPPNACDQTVDGAKQDKTLCPATLVPCGDYALVIKAE